jgi:hypothetical protein
MKPSNSEHGQEQTEYTLHVDSDSLSEIFVIDGRLNLIDRGVGTLNRRLPAGLYTVKVRAGNTAKEKMVVLDQDQTIRLAPAPPTSAAPPVETALTHEYHVTEAIRMSSQVDLDFGRGAAIFVFVRCWTSPSIYRDIGLSDFNPAKGISVLTLDGKLIAQVENQVSLKSSKDPYAGLTMSVDPGPYLLRQSIDGGRSLDQMIYASAGWQTQVFLVRANPHEDSSETSETSLPNSNRITSLSVLMGRSNFHADRDDLRLAEVARATLARERPIQLDPQIIRDALDQKFQNPVLGLFAAHFMLLAKDCTEKVQRTTPSSRLRKRCKRPIEDFDQNLFDLVVQNLTKLLGADHPDVQALSLKCSQQGPGYVGTFSVPPMLRRSWSLIVDANDDISSLLSLDLWKTVAQMTPFRPFLTWVTFQGNDQELRQKLVDAVNQPSFEEIESAPQEGPARDLFSNQPAEEVPQEPSLRHKMAREMGIPKVALDWASERK